MNRKSVTHLSLEDRKNIELRIVEGLSKFQIAKKINRNPSTKDCHRCIKKCERYQEPLCLR